ncbi:MAG: C-terminal binding protein [Deltaproteobacteria bacterium]|nr:C-terminal binding protein [Deltaproteobacteria bacterium]
MMKFKVPITDYVSPPAVCEEKVLADVAEVPCLEQVEESGLTGKIEDADALIVFHTIRISAFSIRRLRKCRAIVRCGVGYDNVDLAAAGAKGIYVCNVPDYGTEEVADHAMALMLACARGLPLTEKGLRKTLAPWNFLAASPLRRLAGATLGIIGLGRIGTAVALRAKGFRLKIVACDPYLPDGYDKALGVTMLPLNELMAVSDIVSVHTPLTPETTQIVGAAQLAKMKPHGILINTARGKCVDVQAVAESLRDGKIGGAGLDVLPDEPPAKDDPIVRLWQQDDSPVNLIVTPHNAFYTEQSREEMRTKAAMEVRRVLIGEKPRNVVNREFLPRGI